MHLCSLQLFIFMGRDSQLWYLLNFSLNYVISSEYFILSASLLHPYLFSHSLLLVKMNFQKASNVVYSVF